MTTPRPEIVLIAGEADVWRGPVEELIAGRIDLLALDPSAALPETLDSHA